jgi:hypothetical protein
MVKPVVMEVEGDDPPRWGARHQTLPAGRSSFDVKMIFI